MTKNELVMLQSLPLDIKIAKSRLRLEEFIDHIGGPENAYISFSGGKDSTVLLHFVRSFFPAVQAVFIDTGLEYPETKKFVYEFENTKIIRPKLSFKEVIEKHGYPVVSKEQSQFINEYRTTNSLKLKDIRLNGNKYNRGKISKKHLYLIKAPFKISHKCCDILKKNPAKKYEKETNKKPIIGILASESQLRTQKYLKNGCNVLQGRVQCNPFGFWTEQDILLYLKKYNLKISPVYGEIKGQYPNLYLTKLNRTGCIFCMFGIEKEEVNRFQKLEETHPQLHTYCMEKLGFKEVCEFMNIKYKK